MRRVVLLVGLLGLALGGAGCLTRCSGDEEAMKACAEAARTSDACRRCCEVAGALGHTYVTGSPCHCL